MAETFEVGSKKTPARSRRLQTVTSVRRMVARTLRKLEAGQAEPDSARVMIYGGKILAELIQGEELSARMAALEARLKEKEQTLTQ